MKYVLLIALFLSGCGAGTSLSDAAPPAKQACGDGKPCLPVAK